MLGRGWAMADWNATVEVFWKPRPEEVQGFGRKRALTLQPVNAWGKQKRSACQGVDETRGETSDGHPARNIDLDRPLVTCGIG